jgi:tagatose-1,6-bisphosphate aldolase
MFAILTMDYRISLIKSMEWKANGRETAYTMDVQFKKEIVSQLSKMADAYLFDPECRVAQSFN